MDESVVILIDKDFDWGLVLDVTRLHVSVVGHHIGEHADCHLLGYRQV